MGQKYEACTWVCKHTGLPDLDWGRSSVMIQSSAFPVKRLHGHETENWHPENP